MKRMIDEENEKYYRPRGLEIINPISNGLVLISFLLSIHYYISIE